MIKNPEFNPPKIGLRIIKTAIAVFACFFISNWLNMDGMPFYSVIAAILCMQPDIQSSVTVGRNRIVGTIIGGIFGLIMLYILRIPIMSYQMLKYAAISVSIIPLIYLMVLLKKNSSAYITCVVYLSIVVSHSQDIIPYHFAFCRVVDTMLGIFVAIGINAIPFLKNRHTD